MITEIIIISHGQSEPVQDLKKNMSQIAFAHALS